MFLVSVVCSFLGQKLPIVIIFVCGHNSKSVINAIGVEFRAMRDGCPMLGCDNG